MSEIMLTFTPDGQGRCLYTEAIDLGKIGSLTIERATHIEFDNKAQRWRVYDGTGVGMFSGHSRQECLDWERQHLDLQETMSHEL